MASFILVFKAGGRDRMVRSVSEGERQGEGARGEYSFPKILKTGVLSVVGRILKLSVR